jgi:hypothetical protein
METSDEFASEERPEAFDTLFSTQIHLKASETAKSSTMNNI